MTEVWVIGNGGHAKVVIDILRMSGKFEIAGIISDDPESLPIAPTLCHVGPISIGTIEKFAVKSAIIAIGANEVRWRIVNELDGAIEWITAIHPTAVVATSATIGAGSVLAAGSIVQPFVSIGDHAIVNTGSTVDHDTVVENYVHLAPGVHVAGGVVIGRGTLVGVGASIIPGISVGEWSTVGAAAALVRDLPSNVTAIGVPARIVTKPSHD